MTVPASPTGVGDAGTALRSRHRRRLLGLGILVLALFVVCIASLMIGAQRLGLHAIWYGLTHRYHADTIATVPAGMRDAVVIVQTLRIPRTVLALLAGAALGVAGTLTQGHTRNPIAEPGLLGVSAGAAFAVAVCVGVVGLQSPLGYIWFALLGGLATAALVFAFGSLGRGGASPLTLVLLGAGLSATLGAGTSALSLVKLETADEMRRWVVGSVAGRGWNVIEVTAPFIVLGLVVACATGPTLNLLNLGDDVARGAGIHVERARLLGLATLSLLTGAATAACGPIVLLGLVVPHLVRTITGPDYRWLLPFSALAGAILLLACDVLGRVLARSEVPAGLVVAMVGAPFFIAVVRRRRLVAV